MAVPPSRALLVAELPVSGRARTRVRVGKLPLFGEPRTRRRFSKQYYAARQKSLLDAGVIWSGRWASIVLALPEADGAFVDCEHCRESRCVMPARVRAARNCRPVTRLILR